MVSDDFDAGSKVNFFYFKISTKNLNSALYIGKLSHHYDVVSISVVEFIDKQPNDNKMMKFSIKLFG